MRQLTKFQVFALVALFATGSYALGGTVAVGYASSASATSNVGLIYSAGTMNSAAGWGGIAWNGSVFAASVYASQEVDTSPDGVTWSTHASALPAASDWVGMAWNGTVFCTVSGNSSKESATSLDGITWIDHATAMPNASAWNGVAWNGTVFVAITLSSQETATSSDCITWVDHASALPAASAWYGVASNGTSFVAIVNNSQITATSPDGITWTNHATAMPNAHAWQAIAWNGFLYIAAVSSSQEGATSPDGITWVDHTTMMPSAGPWRAMASSISVGPDQTACPTPSTIPAAGPLSVCPNAGGATTATAITTASFANSKAIELICVSAAAQGVAITGVTISDSGITKSQGWTLIKSCTNGTTNYAAEICAITSAQISAKTVTATFTATTMASSELVVAPFVTSETVLPTNGVCATGLAGVATLSITETALGTLVLEAGTDTADQTARTPTTSPIAYIPKSVAGSVAGIVWGENAWANSSVGSSVAVGTTAPTSTHWSLVGSEILLINPVVASTPLRSLMGVGTWLTPYEIPHKQLEIFDAESNHSDM